MALADRRALVFAINPDSTDARANGGHCLTDAIVRRS